MTNFEKYLSKIGFFEQDEKSWDMENRDCSIDDQQEYHGHHEIEQRFKEYFLPIAKKVNEKAKEFKVKGLQVEPETYYGILSVTWEAEL